MKVLDLWELFELFEIQSCGNFGRLPASRKLGATSLRALKDFENLSKHLVVVAVLECYTACMSVCTFSRPLNERFEGIVGYVDNLGEEAGAWYG